jgi:hypothetical protein
LRDLAYLALPVAAPPASGCGILETMDDVTNERFRRIEERLEKLEGAVLGMEERLSGKLDNVARGLERMLTGVIDVGFRLASEERRALHAEQMRRFQDVMDEAHARRFKELEARIAKLEALLAERGPH